MPHDKIRAAARKRMAEPVSPMPPPGAHVAGGVGGFDLGRAGQRQRGVGGADAPVVAGIVGLHVQQRVADDPGPGQTRRVPSVR